jgi:hypothetical protein
MAICRPRRSPSPVAGSCHSRASPRACGLPVACTVGAASLSGRTGICAASGISARELELNLLPGQAAALATAGTASGSLWPPVASQWAGPAPAAGPPRRGRGESGESRFPAPP